MDTPKPMSPEEFAEKIERIRHNCDDVELRHGEMDSAMVKLLRSLGYGAAMNIFENTPKYYA